MIRRAVRIPRYARTSGGAEPTEPGGGGASSGVASGAACGVAVLLLFFYIDALVLLIGAEINSEIDFEVLKVKRGTRDFRPAESVAEVQPEGGAPSLANISVAHTNSAAPTAEEGIVRT